MCNRNRTLARTFGLVLLATVPACSTSPGDGAQSTREPDESQAKPTEIRAAKPDELRAAQPAEIRAAKPDELRAAKPDEHGAVKPAPGSQPAPAAARELRLAERLHNPSQCATDADCTLVDDYCTACDCRALAKGETLLKCDGPGVQCLVAACEGKKATCQDQHCVVR